MLTATFQTLLSFNGTDGEYPFGDLTLGESTLYGMTNEGGVDSDGTIFSIPVTGGTPATMLSLNGTNGAYPLGSLARQWINTLWNDLPRRGVRRRHPRSRPKNTRQPSGWREIRASRPLFCADRHSSTYAPNPADSAGRVSVPLGYFHQAEERSRRGRDGDRAGNGPAQNEPTISEGEGTRTLGL